MGESSASDENNVPFFISDKYDNDTYRIRTCTELDNAILNASVNKYEYRLQYTALVNSIAQTGILFPFDKKRNSFYANSVIQLSSIMNNPSHTKLSMTSSIHMTKSIVTQIHWLQQNGWGVYAFGPSDVTVVDSHIALITNCDRLCKINTNTYGPTITFLNPLPTPLPLFADPILHSIRDLPFTIHTNVVYYSIAAFFVYCAYDTEYITPKLLSSIEFTKPYYFVLKCMKSNLDDRSIVYI